MSAWLVPALQTWPEIRADVAANWYIYASMPFIAAAIGYVTKIVAIEMLYRPLRFVGIGPFGWQGLVPRRAGKVAAVTIELLTENLLDIDELLGRMDGADAVDRLRIPLRMAVDEVAREVVDMVTPGGWDNLPVAVRRAVILRIDQRAPRIVDSILGEVRADAARFIDLHHLTVSTLVEQKQRLNVMMRTTAGASMIFLRKTGLVFGLGIGLVQTVAWATIHSVWIMPAFGLVTGFLSDWIALTLLFRPTRERRLLGLRFRGVLHANRDQITRDYAKIMAADLFEPSALMGALLDGPGADRIIALVQREVSAELRRQLGPARPLVQIGLGSQRYRDMQRHMAERALSIIREMPEIEAYATEVLDVENLLAEKMGMLTDEQFEGIMRPIFKDDEWLMISVGAVLGFVVGEIQVEVVTRLGGA
ncbi:MAG TPA: DUF445 domain-containing protein [Nocardioides sp.]|nr:DUF445 domain-containing protein [Nocardioides sp.]